MAGGVRGRSHTLDAMRGIAAIVVVIDHLYRRLGGYPTAGAHLAVDFFFALSGYVIARAYRAKLEQGLTVGRFLELRIIRLYPLYALGMAIGLTTALVKIALQSPEALPVSVLMAAVTINGLMLPVPYFAMFPLNPPTWSLFFEIAINAAYASILVGLSHRLKLLITLICAAILVHGAWQFGSLNRGLDWSTFAFGLTRATFSFGLGLLVEARLTERRITYLAFVPLLLLTLVLLFPAPGPFRLAIDLFAAFLILPGLLWLGTRYELPQRFARTAAMLGDLSYPLYAIHFPLLITIEYAQRHFLHWPYWMLYLVSVSGLLILAWAAAKFFDAPLRARISSTFHLYRSAPSQAI